MHNQAKQADIPTPAELADNLIGSLDGLTDIVGANLCGVVQFRSR